MYGDAYSRVVGVGLEDEEEAEGGRRKAVAAEGRKQHRRRAARTTRLCMLSSPDAHARRHARVGCLWVEWVCGAGECVNGEEGDVLLGVLVMGLHRFLITRSRKNCELARRDVLGTCGTKELKEESDVKPLCWFACLWLFPPGGNTTRHDLPACFLSCA